MSSEHPSEDERMNNAAWRAAEDTLGQAWTNTEGHDEFFKTDKLTDPEKIRALAINIKIQSEEYLRALKRRAPKTTARADELFREIEAAHQDLEQSRTIIEDRRCLRVILLNNVEIGKMLALTSRNDQ